MNTKFENYMKRLIREVLSESPQIGYGINWRQLANISDLIKSHADSPDIKMDVDKDFVWLSGPIMGNVYDLWYCLFKKDKYNNFQCCFACLLKQIPSIEGIVTYQPKFSFKMTSFPEKAATKTYIQMMKSHKCIVASDEKQSDAGRKIWENMLNDPQLKDNIFIWNVKDRQIVDTIAPEEMWRYEDRYKDILICILMKDKS